MEPITSTSRVVDTAQYAKARIQQIAQLYEVVDNSELGPGEVTSGPRTVLQRLPRHMRRRAMSHNVKRLPRSTRAFAAQYLALSKHRKKPLSRLWRRRPSNLAKEYLRRSTKCRWLTTHVWHAKRFRMDSKWDHKLAVASYQRGSRPNYRDSQRLVVAHDESYLQCLQLSTQDRDALFRRLAQVHDPLASPSFAFAEALRGGVEGSMLFHTPSTDSSRTLIGPVRFVWSSNTEATLYLLSIWMHPSTYEPIKQHLRQCCLLTIDADSHPDTQPDSAASATTKGDQSDIKLNEMGSRYVRFQLMGPASLALLSKLLIPNNFDGCGDDDDDRAAFRESNDYWNRYGRNARPTDFRDGTLLALLAEDPRLYRASSMANGLDTSSAGSIPTPPRPPHCFWNNSFIEKQAKRRLSNAEFAKLISENIGAVKSTSFKVPIMLVVRNTASTSSPAANRVDVVAPAIVGQDLWRAINFAGARAIGLNDRLCLNYESGLLNFPEDVPDCSAGQGVHNQESEQLQAKMNRKPANRRTPFDKLRVRHPFSFEFGKLSKEWSPTEEQVLMPDAPPVIRDRRALVQLDRWLCKKAPIPKSVFEKYAGSLVPLRLELHRRGHPKRLALICLSKPADLSSSDERKSIVENINTGEKLEDVNMPGEDEAVANGDPAQSESLAIDKPANEKIISLSDMFPDEEAVKAGKKRRKKEKQRERVKRKRTSVTNAEPPQPSEPGDDSEYRNSCSRVVVGRVVRGGYSLATGKGVALGYCILKSLENVRDGTVLIRNASSKFYHPAKISVLTDRLDL